MVLTENKNSYCQCYHCNGVVYRHGKTTSATSQCQRRHINQTSATLWCCRDWILRKLPPTLSASCFASQQLWWPSEIHCKLQVKVWNNRKLWHYHGLSYQRVRFHHQEWDMLCSTEKSKAWMTRLLAVIEHSNSTGGFEKQSALKLRWRQAADCSRGGFRHWNARSLTVDSQVRQITSCEDDDDRRRRRLESATLWM